MVTFAVNNYRDDEEDLQFKRSLAWESAAIEYIEKYLEENDDLVIRYMMEVGIEKFGSFTQEEICFFQKTIRAYWSKRRVETNGSFQNHPNSLEIVITWCYRKPFH